MPSTSSRLPSLGPRGEGWVAGQFALIALVAVLGLRRRGADRLPRRVRSLPRAMGAGSMLLGALLGVAGARDLGRNLTPMPRPADRAELVQSGMYRRIRHPIYAALMLMTLGWGAVRASQPSLVAAGLLVVWLDAKARREEAWLIGRYADYPAYRRRTRRFVPGLY